MSDELLVSPVLRRISLIIQQKALSISRIARDLSIPQPTVSDIVGGRTKVSLAFFLAFCKVYGVDPIWLAYGGGNTYISAASLRETEEATINENPINEQASNEISNNWLTVHNIFVRFPDVAVPGLVDLLKHERAWSLRLTSEELEYLVKTVRDSKGGLDFVDDQWFALLILGLRKDRLMRIQRLFDEWEKQKS